jgi:pimeloyl-ACP methyl ester carboxylesterase
MDNDHWTARAKPFGRVIALHCSGASGAQWRDLSTTLGVGYELTAPEHYGGNSTGPWTGEHVFRLADEAERTIDLIDQEHNRVHLVGHSYGGGVALHVALRRLQAIASLTLYEPSVFHLLRKIGGVDGIEAFAEIKGVTRETGACILRGDYRGAAAYFVDYWGGKALGALFFPINSLRLHVGRPKRRLISRHSLKSQPPLKTTVSYTFPY